MGWAGDTSLKEKRILNAVKTVLKSMSWIVVFLTISYFIGDVTKHNFKGHMIMTGLIWIIISDFLLLFLIVSLWQNGKKLNANLLMPTLVWAFLPPMLFAAGSRDRLGIVTMSPRMATKNPAPALK